MLKILNSCDLVLLSKNFKYLKSFGNFLLVSHVFKFKVDNFICNIMLSDKFIPFYFGDKRINDTDHNIVKFLPEYEGKICFYAGGAYLLQGGITLNIGVRKIYLSPELLQSEFNVEYISFVNKKDGLCDIKLSVGNTETSYKFKFGYIIPHESPHTTNPGKISPEILSVIKEKVESVTSYISKEIIGEIESLINIFT